MHFSSCRWIATFSCVVSTFPIGNFRCLFTFVSDDIFNWKSIERQCKLYTIGHCYTPYLIEIVKSFPRYFTKKRHESHNVMHCRFKEEWIIHFLVVLTQVQSISDDFFCLLNEYANMNMQASFIENKNIHVFR